MSESPDVSVCGYCGSRFEGMAYLNHVGAGSEGLQIHCPMASCPASRKVPVELSRMPNAVTMGEKEASARLNKIMQERKTGARPLGDLAPADPYVVEHAKSRLQQAHDARVKKAKDNRHPKITANRMTLQNIADSDITDPPAPPLPEEQGPPKKKKKKVRQRKG